MLRSSFSHHIMDLSNITKGKFQSHTHTQISSASYLQLASKRWCAKCLQFNKNHTINGLLACTTWYEEFCVVCLLVFRIAQNFSHLASLNFLFKLYLNLGMGSIGQPSYQRHFGIPRMYDLTEKKIQTRFSVCCTIPSISRTQRALQMRMAD